MAKCKVCGFRLADGTTKCPMCGAAAGSTVAGDVAENMDLPRYFCPSCKGQIIGEHRYCPHCGADLKKAAERAESPSARGANVSPKPQEQGENKCVKCGAVLPPHAKFCAECGTPVPIKQTVPTQNGGTSTAATSKYRGELNAYVDADFDVNDCMKAANAGDPWAQYNLAKCYRYGYNVGEDESKAAYWGRLAFNAFTKLAEENSADAQYALGECYDIGVGCEKDDEQASHWYEKAGRQGDANIQFELGSHYDGFGGDDKKAFYWYKKAAEQGVAAAQKILGFCYADGTGCEQDDEKAFYWYKKAAEQGYPLAQWDLGECYADGMGCGRDDKKASYWYKKAVENSENYARGGKQAFCWYEKAAKQGNVAAQYALGKCYKDGAVCEQDDGKAFDWYKKAAEQGYAAAQCALGKCYEDGAGCEQDDEKAFQWYKKAAEQGYAAGQWALGNCYEFGTGCEQDDEKASYWYSK